MLKGVTVSELKEILKTTKPPKVLIDPVTELPYWDHELMKKIKNAKTMEEIIHLEEPVKKAMEADLDKVYPRIWIGNYKAAKVQYRSN